VRNRRGNIDDFVLRLDFTLPFRNRDGDGEDQKFCEGTNELEAGHWNDWV
jgi:hypothetical protein